MSQMPPIAIFQMIFVLLLIHINIYVYTFKVKSGTTAAKLFPSDSMRTKYFHAVDQMAIANDRCPSNPMANARVTNPIIASKKLRLLLDLVIMATLIRLSGGEQQLLSIGQEITTNINKLTAKIDHIKNVQNPLAASLSTIEDNQNSLLMAKLIGLIGAKINKLTAKIDQMEKVQHSLAANISAIESTLTKMHKQIGEINEIGKKADKMLKALRDLVEKLEQIELRDCFWTFIRHPKKLFLHTGQDPNNNWNPDDCHSDMVVNETRKSVQISTHYDYRSCRAKAMVPQLPFGLFYFEVEILHKGNYSFQIGLAPKGMPLNESLTDYNGSYAYESHGRFWGHSVEGASKWRSNDRSYISGIPRFSAGDIVGVGVNLDTRQIIYTKNGQRLDTTGLFVDSVDLYPAVTFSNLSDAVEANFGPNFKYNLAHEFE